MSDEIPHDFYDKMLGFLKFIGEKDLQRIIEARKVFLQYEVNPNDLVLQVPSLMLLGMKVEFNDSVKEWKIINSKLNREENL